MSEYEWVETRLRAVELFDDAPGAALEQRVLDVFREHPNLVVEAIEHVGRRFHEGKVRAPWVILARHVEEAMRPLEDVTASDERDREKAVRRAEQWIRAAGKHFDRVEEILDEFFGELGRLRPFDSPELRERMARVWRDHRPEGELLDERAAARARAHVATFGQVPGAEGRPVTRPPWKLPAVRSVEAEPIDDPEPVSA